MGCVSSKILAKSGSFQETVSRSFQRSNVIEEIILSSSKSNGDQFLALLCTSNTSARKAKEPEQSLAAVADPAPAKIETIDVSELLAGLEEENYATEQEQEQHGGRKGGERSPAQCAADGTAGPSRSFRTVEEFDALVTQSGSSGRAPTPAPGQEKPRTAAGTTSNHGATAAAGESSCSGRAPAPAPEQEEPRTAAGTTSNHGATAAAGESSCSWGAPAPAPEQEEPRTAAGTTSSHGATAVAWESSSPGREEPARQGEAEAAGAKRRARARQLGELSVPTTFDFSKSCSLRDWLLRGGQTFSPGSYVTPKFGTAPAPAGAREDRKTAEQQQHAVFDPELVSQLDRAMEQLSKDEERVITEILEALELDGGEKEGTAAVGRVTNQPVALLID